MRLFYRVIVFLLLSKIACFQSTCWGQCLCFNDDYVCTPSGIQNLYSGSPYNQEINIGQVWELDRQYYGGDGGANSRCDLSYDLSFCGGTNDDRLQYFGTQIGISLGDNIGGGVEACAGQSSQDTLDNSSVRYSIYSVAVNLTLTNNGADTAYVRVDNAENSLDRLYDFFDSDPLSCIFPVQGGDTRNVTVYLYGRNFFNMATGPGGLLYGTVVDSFDIPDMDDNYVYGTKQNYLLLFRLADSSTGQVLDYSSDDVDVNVTIHTGQEGFASGSGVIGCVIDGVDCGGTATPSPTASNTPVNTPPFTPVPTSTPTPTASKTLTPSWTPTNTPNPSDTATPTWTASNTPTHTNTPNLTATPTNTNTNIIPTVVATPGANTYNLCVDSISSRDESNELNDPTSYIGYHASDGAYENVNFIRFRVPMDAAIAADNVRIKTCYLEWQSSRGNLTTAQTLNFVLKQQSNYIKDNWYVTADSYPSPVIDFETYVAPSSSLSVYKLTFDITQVVPLNGANYSGNEDTFLYFCIRSLPAAEGDTSVQAIDGVSFPSACTNGTMSALGDSARLVFTYDTNNTAPTPVPTLTAMPTPTVNSDNAFLTLPIATQGPLGSDGSVEPTISNKRIGWWNETEWLTMKNEMLTYPMTINIDTDGLVEGQYWYTGPGSKYDRVLLNVDFLQDPSSEGGSMDVMVVGSQNDPRVSFNALKTALVLGRGTLQDSEGYQRITFNVTGIFPDILASSDLDDSYYITIMPDTRGFYTGQSFRIANADFDLYWSNPTPTFTYSPTFTPSETFTPSNTPTVTNTPIPTPTNTPIPPTNTPTNTPPGPTATFTHTPTFTKTNTPTSTATPTNTGTNTPTPTSTPTGLYKPLIGSETRTGIIIQNPVGDIETLLANNAIWDGSAAYAFEPGKLKFPYTLADPMMTSATMIVTSDATAVIQIADSASTAVFAATMENPDATAAVSLGTDEVVWSATDINFNGVGFGPSTNSEGAIVLHNGTARDGEVYWNASENALYFGDYAKQDMDTGMDIEGRLTAGSGSNQMAFWDLPGRSMPAITSGAFEFDTDSFVWVGPSIGNITNSSTKEVGQACPICTNGTVIDKVRFYFDLRDAAHAVSMTVYAVDTDWNTTTIAEAEFIPRSSMTNFASTYYYYELDLNHTIDNEKVWARVEMYRGAAALCRYWSPYWLFDGVVR